MKFKNLKMEQIALANFVYTKCKGSARRPSSSILRTRIFA